MSDIFVAYSNYSGSHPGSPRPHPGPGEDPPDSLFDDHLDDSNPDYCNSDSPIQICSVQVYTRPQYPGQIIGSPAVGDTVVGVWSGAAGVIVDVPSEGLEGRYILRQLNRVPFVSAEPLTHIPSNYQSASQVSHSSLRVPVWFVDENFESENNRRVNPNPPYDPL